MQILVYASSSVGKAETALTHDLHSTNLLIPLLCFGCFIPELLHATPSVSLLRDTCGEFIAVAAGRCIALLVGSTESTKTMAFEST